MPDHLAIATSCAAGLSPGTWDLLGLHGRNLARFIDRMALAACIDLQIAMEQAWATGQVRVPGQAIACEQAGADWLPFLPLARVSGMRGKGSEVAWLNNGADPRAQLAWCMP